MVDGIGIGWSFPPHFDYLGGTVTMTTGEADINGSLAVLFSTRLKERLFRPNYGSSLEDFLFKPLSTAAVNRLTEMIDKAVQKYEPRIRLRGIDIGKTVPAEGVLEIVLQYTIRGDYSEDGSVHTFIYDFD